jgi:uncharacterized protein (TIGR00369 family)
MSAPEPAAGDRWPPIPRAELREWFNGLAVTRSNGIECRELADEEARVVLTPPEGYLNRNGSVNGASLAAFCDLSCGVLIAGVCKPGEYPATLELSIRYVRAAIHPPLVAHVRLLRRGGSHAWPEAEIRDSKGQVCCVASGTWSITVARQLGGGGVH